MRYVELICRAARAAHAEQAGIGVRLSPVRLSADEATALATTARALLGPKVYVAVAAPGVTPREDERTCLAPGEHAAERATAWRNLVNTGDGEWILYVSVERLGRAGGLHDTLRAIDEAALRRELLAGEAEEPSPIPAALARALMDSGVAERAPTQALCALHEAIRAAPPERRWEVAGQSLPLLGLAADSRLEDRPDERLRGNLRWVQEAGAREGRGAGSRQPVKSALAEAISAGARAESLQRVDLGAVRTEELSPPSKARAKGTTTATSTAPAPTTPISPPRSSNPPRGPEGLLVTPPPPPVSPPPPAPPTPPRGAETADEPAQILAEPTREPRGDLEPQELEPIEDAPTDPGRPDPEADPTPPPSPPAPSPTQLPLQPKARALKAAPWERELPSAAASLVEAALQGDGACLCWELRGGAPRAALERPPAGLPRPRRMELAVSDALARDALAAWIAARTRLLDALAELGLGSTGLSRAPALPHAALELAGDAAQALVDSAEAALTRLAEAERSALPSALARDTICLHSPIRGEALLLLTPLHPLVVGAALARADLWRQARPVPTDERGPILHLLSRAAPAPARWPLPWGGALQAAAPLAGAPVYETRPTAISEGTLSEVAEALTRRFLELHPHARLGLSVLIDAEGCGPLIEGVARSLADDDAAGVGATVLAPEVPALSERAGALVTAGRVTLAPLPADPAERAALAPHLEILLPRARPPAPTRAPAAPSDGPLPRPARRLVEGGWELRLSTRAVVGGAALEAAVAAALGEPAQGAFTALVSAPPVAGASGSDPGTWRAVLAPQLGAAPRVGPLVLLEEQLPDARLAVLSQDTRAVARAMTESFRAVGVRDTRPNVVESLVKQLARATGSALPLRGSTQDALVARVLERVVAEGLGDGAVVAPLGEDRLEAVQPGLRLGGPPAVIGAALGRGLNVRIGVAFTALSPVAALPEAAQRALAVLGDWARRVGRADRLAGAAARELLTELLWPRLAAMAPRGEALAWLLEGAAPTEVSVSAVALVPTGDALAGRTGLKAGDLAVDVVALDHALVQRVVLGAG